MDSLAPVPEPFASSSSAAGPAPLVSAPSSSQGVSFKPRIALDLHNSLDDGSRSGRIPEAHANCCERLLQQGFAPWVCSYIGRSLEESADRQRKSQQIRDNACQRVRELARRLELNYEDRLEVGPSREALFLCITNRKNWAQAQHRQGYLNGKAVSYTHLTLPTICSV